MDEANSRIRAEISMLERVFFGSTILVATSSPQGIRPSSVVYWSRFALAILTAFLCFLLRLRGSTGVAVALAIYIVSSIFYQYGLRYGEEQMKGKYRTVSLGSGTFAFVWASLWILLFTVRPY